MIPNVTAHRLAFIILAFSVLGLLNSFSLRELAGGDWPQVLGPERNSRAIHEQPLARSWSSAPPKQLWKIPVGSGYAGAAIADGKAFLFDRIQEQERLVAVDLKTGQRLWQAKWQAAYRSSMDPDSGPRAVPCISGDTVVCYGAAGDLVAINTLDGAIRWQRGLRKETRAEDGYFGAGCSPLVVDGTIVLNIGGKKAGVVGIDVKSGKTVWQTADYSASYASPISVTVGSQRAALVVTGLKTLLIEIETGKILSEIDFGARGPTVNAATPISVGSNRFLLTASYGVGAHLVEIDGKSFKRIWKNPVLASQYNSPVFFGGLVVGADGREDMGQAKLKGIDLAKPEAVWEKELPGTTHLIAVGEDLLQLSIDGRLAISHLENRKMIDDGELQLPVVSSGRALYRALPALSNHILVVRQTQDGTQGLFLAYELP